MIHYELRCAEGHAFDGWFRSSAAFDQQAQSGLLDCPVCASPRISRAMMAPRLARGAASPTADIAATSAAPAAEKAVAVAKPTPPVRPTMPDQLRAALQRMRAEVEQHCDYVGPRFAETARAIHAGQTPARPIYGEASPEQAEALAEDGIEVASIPWVPRADG